MPRVTKKFLQRFGGLIIPFHYTSLDHRRIDSQIMLVAEWFVDTAEWGREALKQEVCPIGRIGHFLHLFQTKDGKVYSEPPEDGRDFNEFVLLGNSGEEAISRIVTGVPF